jgi:hypothetical protein
MNMTRVTTRRSALGLSIFGFLALFTGCDSGGVAPSTIDSIKDQGPGKAEANARQQQFGTTGQPKSERPK